jgi:hypothetical protein
MTAVVILAKISRVFPRIWGMHHMIVPLPTSYSFLLGKKKIIIERALETSKKHETIN